MYKIILWTCLFLKFVFTLNIRSVLRCPMFGQHLRKGDHEQILFPQLVSHIKYAVLACMKVRVYSDVTVGSREVFLSADFKMSSVYWL